MGVHRYRFFPDTTHIQQPDDMMSPSDRAVSPSDRAAGAYQGLQDYGGLLSRSNQTYDLADRAAEQSGDVFGSTATKIANSAGRMSPMSPWFQAVQESAGNKKVRMGQDVERPHGIADDPQWWMSGDNNGSGDQGPLSHIGIFSGTDNQNLARPNRLDLAVRGLRKGR